MIRRCWILFPAALLAGCALLKDPEPGGETSGVASVTSGSEASPAVALALAASLEAEGDGALPDGVLPRRVDRFGRQVCEAAGAPVVSVTLLESARVVGRALPGGHLQLSRGLLAAVRQADARQPLLVALLAHLAGHLALEQPERALAERLQAGGHTLPARVGGLVDGSLSDAEAQAFGEALRAARAGSPSGCAEADAVACEALARLGLAPAELVRAYEALATLEDRAPEQLAPWSRRHGPPGARRASAVAAVGETKEREEASPPPSLPELPLKGIAGQQAAWSRVAAAELLVGRGLGKEALALLAEDGGAPAATSGGRVAVARAHSLAGDAKQAERSLRVALVQQPGHFAARLELARLYLSQGRGESAADELRQLLKRAPSRPEVHLELGLALGSDGLRRLEIARALSERGDAVDRRAEKALGKAAPPPRPRKATQRPIIGGG